MKLLRLFPCLALLSFVLASCGTEPLAPADVSQSESALHDGNGMWLGGPNYMSGTYACQGDTWRIQARMDQTVSAGVYQTRIQDWFDQTGTEPTLTVSSCINAQEGNQFIMLRSGPNVLYNQATKTCLVYSHKRNEPNNWAYVGSASITPANMQYVKPTPAEVRDRFQFVITVAPGDVGKPGFCSSIGSTFWFSAP